LEFWETDAERRAAAAVLGAPATFLARLSRGSLASPEETAVSRLLDDRCTYDLIYEPDFESNFVYQCMRER